MNTNSLLPEPLPCEPFTLFGEWFELAQTSALQPNPNAMVLATTNARHCPEARVVLCKHWQADPGHLVFFSNYQSDKGEQLQQHPYAAAVFHWDALHRQVRMSGPVVRSPAAESDEYFAQRPLANRIGAWASEQSRPLESRAALAAQVKAAEQRFGNQVPRPPHWGGWRLCPESVELWIEGAGRVHDRAVWTRSVALHDAYSFDCGAWSMTRLNP